MIKKYLLVEKDDDYPFHLEASSKKEMLKKIWEMLRAEGFDDTFIMTEKEYQALKALDNE